MTGRLALGSGIPLPQTAKRPWWSHWRRHDIESSAGLTRFPFLGPSSRSAGRRNGLCRVGGSVQVRSRFSIATWRPVPRDDRRRSGPEVLVNLAYCHSSFADRGCHPLDRATSHVPRRENAGSAGFQDHRLMLRWPLIAIGGRVKRGRAGRNVTVIVELDSTGEPRRVWNVADENEQGPGLDQMTLPRL